jgi:hypothetical protein
MPLSTTFQLYRGGQFFLSEFVSSEHNLFCQSFVVRTQFFCQSFVVRTQFFLSEFCRQNTVFFVRVCVVRTQIFVRVCVVRTQFLYPRSQKGEVGILFYLCASVCPSVRPSKIFFVAFFSATIDGRNLIFGHKFHIGNHIVGSVFGLIRFQLPVCRFCWFLCTFTSVDTEMCCPKGKCGCQYFILLTLKKKIMDTGVLDFFLTKN